MKINNYLVIGLLIIVFPLITIAQDTLYYEFFTDGSMNLDWFTPWGGGDEMQVDYWEGNPSGDNWVGYLENGMSGGGVGTALSGSINTTDYEIRAQIYTTVNTSTYHGIVARWDTTGGFSTYYSFRTDFDANQRLQLRKFPGDVPPYQGQSIAEWTGAQIPGGVPTTDSWHELALKMEGDQLWVYYDGTMLSGSPFSDSYCSAGFFGVYTFNFMNTVATYCDDIVILGEAGPQPFDLIAGSNTMLDADMNPMSILPADGQTVYFRLNWDALNGTGTSSPFTVTLELDGAPFYSTTHPGVQPSSSYQTVSTAWTAVLGEHDFTWALDTGNTVPEGNEGNNTLEDTVSVLDADAYDFQADSSWTAHSDSTQYQWIAVEDELYFRLFWSAPLGQGSSGAFTIEMTLDGQPFYENTWFGILQQGNYTEMTEDPYIAESGFHYYVWTIDVDNWVEEFDEGNNFIMDGFEVNLGVENPWDGVLSGLPQDCRFSGVYPNPFNSSVTLKYENPAPGQVKIAVYDVNGREVTTLFNGYSAAGISEVTWSADNLASGTYFAVLTSGSQKAVQPLIYVK